MTRDQNAICCKFCVPCPASRDRDTHQTVNISLSGLSRTFLTKRITVKVTQSQVVLLSTLYYSHSHTRHFSLLTFQTWGGSCFNKARKLDDISWDMDLIWTHQVERRPAQPHQILSGSHLMFWWQQKCFDNPGTSDVLMIRGFRLRRRFKHFQSWIKNLKLGDKFFQWKLLLLNFLLDERKTTKW